MELMFFSRFRVAVGCEGVDVSEGSGGGEDGAEEDDEASSSFFRDSGTKKKWDGSLERELEAMEAVMNS